MEAATMNIHEAMTAVLDYQTHHKLRESTGRAFAEDLNESVQWWSAGMLFFLLFTGIGQVLVLRSFFSSKQNIRT